MVLVEPLHLSQESGLLPHLGQVVNGLVKDRNVARTTAYYSKAAISIFFTQARLCIGSRYLLLGAEEGLGALHGGSRHLRQVPPQAFLRRGVRLVVESRVDLRIRQNGGRCCHHLLAPLFLAVRGGRAEEQEGATAASAVAGRSCSAG